MAREARVTCTAAIKAALDEERVKSLREKQQAPEQCDVWERTSRLVVPSLLAKSDSFFCSLKAFLLLKA
eukprot:4411726-Pleurochrysis_carterae.AAC.1